MKSEVLLEWSNDDHSNHHSSYETLMMPFISEWIVQT